MKRIVNVLKHTLRIVYNDRTSDYNKLLNRANICTIETSVVDYYNLHNERIKAVHVM